MLSVNIIAEDLGSPPCEFSRAPKLEANFGKLSFPKKKHTVNSWILRHPFVSKFNSVWLSDAMGYYRALAQVSSCHFDCRIHDVRLLGSSNTPVITNDKLGSTCVYSRSTKALQVKRYKHIKSRWDGGNSQRVPRSDQILATCVFSLCTISYTHGSRWTPRLWHSTLKVWLSTPDVRCEHPLASLWLPGDLRHRYLWLCRDSPKPWHHHLSCRFRRIHKLPPEWVNWLCTFSYI